MHTALTFIFTLTILLFAFPSMAQWSDSDTQALLTLEETGQWHEALQQAQRFTGSDNTIKMHLANLRRSVRTITFASKYQQKNMLPQALQLLQEQRKSLETSGTELDAYLLIALTEKINALQVPRQAAVHADIKVQLSQAKELSDEGKLVEADRILANIIQKPAGEVPSELRREAKLLARNNNKQILAATNTRVRKLLNTVAGFNKQEKYDEGLKVLEDILAIPAANLDSTLRSQAQSLKLHTELEKLQVGKPTLLRQIASTLTNGGKNLIATLVYLLAGVGIFILLKFLWGVLRPRSDAIEIALQDNTISGADPVMGNTALSRDLDHTLRKLVEGDGETADLGGLMDLDASGLPSAPQPKGGFESFATHIDTTPVTIGPFSLSPRQLFLYLSLLFRPRYAYTLSGALARSGNEYVLSLKKHANYAPDASEQLYEGRAQSRTEVLQKVATQLLVSLADSKVTDDWRSLQAYVQAEQEMAREIITQVAEQRSVYLSDAKNALQTALLIDPANWLARYRLATVLRKLGQNLAAKQQFDYVGWMLCSDEILQHRHLATYVQNSPLFPCLLIHNRAVCEAKLGAMECKEGRPNTTMAAIETFSYLIQTIKQIVTADSLKIACDAILDCGPLPDAKKVSSDVKKMIGHFLDKLYAEGAHSISETAASELLMLVRAARTAALGDWLEYEHNKYQYSDTTDDDRVEQIFQWIARNEDWFYVQRFELKTSTWTTYALAHATTQNARGRASYLMKDWRSAENFLRWAAGYHLPANFPEPYINLGALYLRRQAYLSKRWMELAEENLSKALEVSPNSKKGRYLLGKLYSYRSYEDKQYEEKALQEFTKAGSDSWSLYRAAAILVERGELVSAVQKLKLSIDLANTVDWRYRLYLDTVLKLARNKQATLEQIHEARQAAVKLHRNGYRKRLREFGANVLAELDTFGDQSQG